ncbi:MAG TPA: DUF6615 family protein [Solirubrobacteraceae bacterium]
MPARIAARPNRPCFVISSISFLTCASVVLTAAWSALAGHGDGRMACLRMGRCNCRPMGRCNCRSALILELRRAHPQEIIVKPFNRHAEAQNGADWAWWFQGKKWLGMRVQAKKLYADSRRYAALAHTIGKTKKRQVDVLISQAKKDKLFPMYCFYNFWDIAAHPLKNVSFNCGTFPPSEHRLGCTLASAEEVKLLAIDQGKDDLATVGRISFPWICLVCCPTGTATGHDLASRIKASLEVQQGPPLRVDGRRRTRLTPKLVDEPPRYVHAAIDGDSHADDLPQGVAGVVVFKDVPRGA